jgi:hypothetical protein
VISRQNEGHRRALSYRGQCFKEITAMKKQFGQNDERRRADQQQQGGNLGQKEARQEKKSETDISHMGERTHEGEKSDK